MASSGDEEGRSTAEIVMTFPCRGKFDSNSYKYLRRSARRGRVGGERAVRLKLTIRRWAVNFMEFRTVDPVSLLKVVGQTERRGTEGISTRIRKSSATSSFITTSGKKAA